MDNIDRLTERLNRCHDPKATLSALCVVLSIFRGSYDAATPGAIRRILEDQEAGRKTA